MKKLLAVLTLCVLSLGSLAVAHTGDFGNQNVGSWDGIEVMHYEPSDPLVTYTDDDFKGWANITVVNTMAQNWGDFHIKLTSFSSQPSVYFDPAFAPITSLTAGYGLTYSEEISAGKPQQINFTFYGNPITPGQSISFQVYTDNTTDKNEWFSLSYWPTPVPEPATLTMLGLGGFLFASKRRKK